MPFVHILVEVFNRSDGVANLYIEMAFILQKEGWVVWNYPTIVEDEVAPM